MHTSHVCLMLLLIYIEKWIMIVCIAPDIQNNINILWFGL